MRVMEGIYVTKTPRIAAALAELQQLIASTYPTATFAESIGTEPIGFYLDVTVDAVDSDDIFATIVDRLIDLQVEDGLPVHVTVRSVPEPMAAPWRSLAAESATA